LIEAPEKLKFANLFFFINVGSRLSKWQGPHRIDLQLNSAVLRTEIVGAYCGRTPATGAWHFT
jgi:hypothetical protein